MHVGQAMFEFFRFPIPKHRLSQEGLFMTMCHACSSLRTLFPYDNHHHTLLFLPQVI